MLSDQVIKSLRQQALDYLKKNLDKGYTYHNADHARDVCAAVEEFAPDADCTIFDLEALRLAAVFHDFGYLESAVDNEILALPYLRRFSSQYDIAGDLIERAGELILESSFPYCPKTAAGKLLCDADIEYIGRPVFWHQAELFRKELTLQGKSFTEEQWWQYELEFLLQNEFYSAACRRCRGEGRLDNIAQVRQRIGTFQDK